MGKIKLSPQKHSCRCVSAIHIYCKYQDVSIYNTNESYYITFGSALDSFSSFFPESVCVSERGRGEPDSFLLRRERMDGL